MGETNAKNHQKPTVPFGDGKHTTQEKHGHLTWGWLGMVHGIGFTTL